MDLFQHKAASLEAVTSWKWLRGRGSRERQGKSRDEQTRTPDKEKVINSTPANTKAGGCAERGSQGHSVMCRPAHTLAFVNNSACWIVSTTMERLRPEGGISTQAEGTAATGRRVPLNKATALQGAEYQEDWPSHSLKSTNSIMLTSLQLVDPF